MNKHGPDVRNLINARRQAESHGMFISEKSDCYLLYRSNANGRPVFVGRVSTSEALLKLVRKAAATQPLPRPATASKRGQA